MELKTLPLRFAVSRHVAASECVDRLPGVPDHKERRVLTAREKTVEDIILNRIGVLKFVHDGGSVFFPDCRCEEPVFVKNTVADSPQEIVECLEILSAFFQCEFMFHVFQRRKQNRVGVCLKLRLQEIVFREERMVQVIFNPDAEFDFGILPDLFRRKA